MESILNPGLPHISDKIFKCLGGHLACRSVNHEFKNKIENQLFEVTKNRFLKEIKCFMMCNFGQKWSTFIEILDQEELWTSDVKENLLLCMIRALNLRKTNKIGQYLNKLDDEPLLMILDLESRSGTPALLNVLVLPVCENSLRLQTSKKHYTFLYCRKNMKKTNVV